MLGALLVVVRAPNVVALPPRMNNLLEHLFLVKSFHVGFGLDVGVMLHPASSLVCAAQCWQDCPEHVSAWQPLYTQDQQEDLSKKNYGHESHAA